MRMLIGALLLALVSGQRGFAQDGATIAGFVRDETGRPIEGADVYAFPEKGRAKTDTAGRFSIRNLPSGYYHVRVRRRAREVLPRLTDEYERVYYTGIIIERRARAQLHRGALGSADVASEGFREAMRWYERAESMRPSGNDEAILRWNTCARLLGRHERASVHREYEPALED
jgi:hypothetical protein